MRRLAIATAHDVVSRQTLELSLLTGGIDGHVLSLDYDSSCDHLAVRWLRADGATHSDTIPRPVNCLTCAARIAIEDELVAAPDDGLPVLVIAPGGIELTSLVPNIVDDIDDSRHALKDWIVTHALTGVDTTVATTLLTGAEMAIDTWVRSCRLTSSTEATWVDESDATIGDVLLGDVLYADTIVAVGEAGMGLDLIEHACDETTDLITTVEDFDFHALWCGVHDLDSAFDRAHPATMQASGGSTAHGVHTIDLHSHRPVHPRQLIERLGDVIPSYAFVRGCFWVPTRPDSVCTWSGTAGKIAIGEAGYWDGDAHTRLIITGENLADAHREIEAAFRDLLVPEEDWKKGLWEWLGKADELEPWLGERK